MALQDKYKELTDAAAAAGVTDLQVREQDDVLYIDGVAPNGAVKDQLWNIYGKIDPDFLSAALRLRFQTVIAYWLYSYVFVAFNDRDDFVTSTKFHVSHYCFIHFPVGVKSYQTAGHCLALTFSEHV